MALHWLDAVDLRIGRRPWRLFEIADQLFVPSAIRECTQAMLTAQWTHRLPWLQSKCPADIAADLLSGVIQYVASRGRAELTVVDFCSGSGGPVPLIEQTVNMQRAVRGLDPVPFMMTDLHPNLDDWMVHSSRSANLSFFPNTVDARDPPAAVINHDAKSNLDFSSFTKVFRLFCLSFHHFDDDAAIKVLKSSLDTSDGFAIIELQDRRLTSVLLMALEYLLMFIVTIIWFPKSPIHLFFTYVLPIIPFIQAFDGLVSALRTRTFPEVLQLVDIAMGEDQVSHGIVTSPKQGATTHRALRGDWIFEGGTALHTYPIGRVNWFIAFKKPEMGGRASKS